MTMNPKDICENLPGWAHILLWVVITVYPWLEYRLGKTDAGSVLGWIKNKITWKSP